MALLVAHFNEMTHKKLWMKSWKSVKSNYISVYTICETLATSQEDLSNNILFHAITGFHTMPHIAGHVNKTA